MASEEGKIFVGALSWATTSEKLQTYFSQYGEVTEANVMMDKVTDHSRGFGFVKFADPSSVEKVLKTRPHILDDKQIDPKPSTPKDVQIQKKEAERLHVTTHKIFIGGLAQTMEEETIRSYFEDIGPVVQVTFAISKDDGKNKGFGFVTFEDSKSVDKAVEMHYHTIEGKRVEAKRAQPRERMRQTNNPQQQQGQMRSNNGQERNWNEMGWAQNPDAYGTVAGGYMNNSGYGGYGNYSYPNPNYNYGYYGDQMSYPMGNYGQQNTSSYGPNKGNSKDGYHPYRR